MKFVILHTSKKIWRGNVKSGVTSIKAAVFRLQSHLLEFLKQINKMLNIKEKIIGATGSLTGSLSFLGGYQVCHNICMTLTSFLTLLGFTVAGMPLLFLTKIAIPFWIAAVSLLAIMVLLKYKNFIHVSDKMILLNSGLIIAGVPFQQVQQYNYVFWIIGGFLIILSVGWYVYDKIKKT